MKSLIPYSILITLSIACVPSGEFVDFKGEVESLDSLQTNIEERLSALEAENTTLSEKLTALEDENTQLQTELTVANDNISDLQNELLALAGDGDTSLTEQVFNNATSIASNTTTITQLQSDQQAAQTQIDALESAGTAAATELTTLAASVATNTSSISTNTSNISSNTSSISSNTSDISTLNTNVSTNTTAIATNTTNIATNTAQVATNTASIATFASEIAGYAATITTNATGITTLNSDVSDAQNDINDLQNDLDTAEASITTLQSDYTSLSGNVLTLIDTDTTWTIDINGNGDYDNLDDAMAAARSVQIHPDVTLTMQIQDGVYAHADSIDLNHPQGSNLVIQGNIADPTAVQLYFSASDGVVLYDGHALAGLSNITIQGDSSGNGTENGLIINNGAHMHIENVHINNFYYGISVNSAALYVEGNNSSNSNIRGINIMNNSTMVFDQSSTMETSNNSNSGVSVSGSYANIYGLTSEYNPHGFTTAAGATAIVSSSNLSNNTSNGAYMGGLSRSLIYSSTINGNSNGVRYVMSEGLVSNSNFSNAYGVMTEYMSRTYLSGNAINDGSYGLYVFRNSYIADSGNTYSNNNGIYTTSGGTVQ